MRANRLAGRECACADPDDEFDFARGNTRGRDLGSTVRGGLFLGVRVEGELCKYLCSEFVEEVDLDALGVCRGPNETEEEDRLGTVDGGNTLGTYGPVTT